MALRRQIWSEPNGSVCVRVYASSGFPLLDLFVNTGMLSVHYDSVRIPRQIVLRELKIAMDRFAELQGSKDSFAAELFDFAEMYKADAKLNLEECAPDL